MLRGPWSRGSSPGRAATDIADPAASPGGEAADVDGYRSGLAPPCCSRGSGRRGRRGDCWRVGFPGPSQSPFAGSTPVSYTHLRAHETKANLVCRLLLEKKKK